MCRAALLVLTRTSSAASARATLLPPIGRRESWPEAQPRDAAGIGAGLVGAPGLRCWPPAPRRGAVAGPKLPRYSRAANNTTLEEIIMAADPVQVASNVYTKLFENDRVRLLEAR